MEDAIKLLKELGGVIENDHFVYSSKRHGDTYINKNVLFLNPENTSVISRSIAKNFIKDDVDVVIGPATGAITLSNWTAYHLRELTQRDVLSIYAEKVDSKERFSLKRGFDDLVIDKNILIVEDIITTGLSAKLLTNLVKSTNGNVVGLGAVVNRGGVDKDFIGVKKLVQLSNINFNSYSKEKCPMCRKGMPINKKFGHNS